MVSTVIVEVAVKVRAWIESLQINHGEWSDDMQGLCAIASYKLKKELDEHGVSGVEIGVHQQMHGQCHCYVLIGNETIVDVTATQFGKVRSRVEIRNRKGAYRVLDWWEPTMVYHTLDSFVEYCNQWYAHQQPKYAEKLSGVG